MLCGSMSERLHERPSEVKDIMCPPPPHYNYFYLIYIKTDPFNVSRRAIIVIMPASLVGTEL